MFSCKKNSIFILAVRHPDTLFMITTPTLHPPFTLVASDFGMNFIIIADSIPIPTDLLSKRVTLASHCYQVLTFVLGIFASVFSNSHYSKYFALKKAPRDIIMVMILTVKALTGIVQAQ